VALRLRGSRGRTRHGESIAKSLGYGVLRRQGKGEIATNASWDVAVMNGHVDTAGRALVRIVVTSPTTATAVDIEAWVDTGFTGELVLPQDRIAALGLPRSAVVKAELGDGSETVLEVYSCLIEWFGHVQQIEVIANTGTSPLLGIGLLRGHTLTVDYAACTLTID